ncbi:MAG: LysM peptidoglycan-binding domain-containing protein [Lachnospiraceae bacterium]|nr:LysM peptidoglycan-binding domain-containing protein [Lachnospiraceae bacterium]
MTLEERRLNWNKRKIERRNKAIRKYSVRFLLVISFLLTVANIIFFISKPVNAKEEKPMIKYYTSIEVKQGETLTSIAKDHLIGYSSVSDYIDEVKFMNSLKDVDDIRTGQKLYIPYYSTEVKE